MALLLVPAAVFTLATLLLAVLWRLGLWLRRRPAPRFWRRTFKAHAGLFALHLFVTVPLLLGVMVSRSPGTRRDEAAYGGPRLAEDGTWTAQSRESLAAERDGKATVDPAVAEAAVGRAVALSASDGVKLRAFLVPPSRRLRRGPAAVRGRARTRTVPGRSRDRDAGVDAPRAGRRGAPARAPKPRGQREGEGHLRPRRVSGRPGRGRIPARASGGAGPAPRALCGEPRHRGGGAGGAADSERGRAGPRRPHG